MITRREFIGVSTVAVAGSACQSNASALQAADDLPSSIAALASMADQPTPITVAERRGRIDKARRLMAENDVGALMMTGGTSLVYFANIRWRLSERLLSIVIPASGRSFVVCPAFEEGRAREQIELGPLQGDADVFTWEEDEDPYALVAGGLRDRGLSSGRLGIEETVRFVFSDGVSKAAPALSLTTATPVTAGCRTVKDEHELDLMRIASIATLRAYHAAYLALDEGMTQGDFAQLVSQAHDQLGFSGGAGVQVGEFSALPHGSRTPQTIREGTILLIDGGCSVEGYRSDLSRTFVLGTPTDRMREIFDIELEAQTAALEAARPGVACEDVDAVTFSDEPGIYIPGEFGVRLEDDMVITEEGAELLTPQSPSLDDPFGVMV